MGILIRIFSANREAKAAGHLKDMLEEMLTDDGFSSKLYAAFSYKEQKAAAQGLIKIGIQSASLTNWRSKYS